jgi:phospholysine phosphohistidine inorganic pyrophosphate phosphatase
MGTVNPGTPRGYLLDLDGTLYSGGAAIPGAIETLARLRRRSIPYRLVTNTTSRSRSLLVQRLDQYGFEVSPDEIFTATLAAGELARGAGHIRVAPFLPEPALEDLTGLDLGGGTAGKPRSWPPDAILVGDLGQAWNYVLMQEAFNCLTEGAAFIAVSRDRYWLDGDRLALDAGPFVAALEYASGRTATIAGKPSSPFYQAAVRSLGLSAAEPVAMVGDDLWSDVEGAQQAGFQGWLVRTGKYRDSVLRESGIRPDRILDSVAALD